MEGLWGRESKHEWTKSDSGGERWTPGTNHHQVREITGYIQPCLFNCFLHVSMIIWYICYLLVALADISWNEDSVKNLKVPNCLYCSKNISYFNLMDIHIASFLYALTVYTFEISSVCCNIAWYIINMGTQGNRWMQITQYMLSFFYTFLFW